MSETLDLSSLQGNTYVLQAAMADLADEAYTSAKKLVGTGVVSTPEGVNVDTETYAGQLRWNRPIQANINVGSAKDPTDGSLSSHTMGQMDYIKTTRSVGMRESQITAALTQKNGLAKLMTDQNELRLSDQNNAILSVLRGVAISEALKGIAGSGGQSFENDPSNAGYGFYVDLGASASLIATQSSTDKGAYRAKNLLEAFGKGYKDYEPDYAYLVATPSMMADLRSANLIDSEGVADGDVMFETIFQGKFRLIKSRANMGFTSAEHTALNAAKPSGSGLALGGKQVAFIILPGAIGFKDLTIPMPVEAKRNASSFKGMGSTELWYRWGYVAHPVGYSWVGKRDDFAADADYSKITTDSGATWRALSGAATEGQTGTWRREATSAVSLGILPIFYGS